MIQTETASRIDLHTIEPDVRVVHSIGLTWWGAIVAGAITAMALQAVFVVLGAAIGLSVASATDNSASAFGIGAGIYWLITGLISLFFGGLVTGWLMPVVDRRIAALHGFFTWALVTVISTFLFAWAGTAVLGGSLSAAANLVGSGNVDVTDNSGQGPIESVSGEVRDAVGTSDVERTAERTAESSAAVSWFALLGLVLGATVACAGGLTGARTLESANMNRTGR